MVAADGQDRSQGDSAEDDGSAGQGPWPGTLADHDEYPDRIQDRLDHRDEAGLHRGDVSDRPGQEEVGQAQLDDAQDSEDEPFAGFGKRWADESETDGRSENIADHEGGER